MLHVLFVCTGNTCRSPMAQGLFEHISIKYNIKSMFSSAGLGFCGNSSVSSKAVTVCNEVGVDISRHKPRTLREYDIEITDIFVVMTETHAKALIDIGVPKNKIYVLGGGIPDPYGYDLLTYRHCRNMISDGLEEFCKILRHKMDNGTIKENNNEQHYDM